MSAIEFTPWPKISRKNPFEVTISEKMDGTNACVVINDGKIVAVQSRKRFITPENDNYGFAAWVVDNTEELLLLGDGHHFGEWVGPGIQKNPHRLEERTFFLFNTYRWNTGCPSCCSVVPVLFEGTMDKDTVEGLLDYLKQVETYQPEGLVVYYHTFRQYTKHTLKSPNGKWFDEV